MTYCQQTHPNGELNLLLNRLIECEVGEEELAEIQRLLCDEPTAMDAYFDLIEIHALLCRQFALSFHFPSKTLSWEYCPC